MKKNILLLFTAVSIVSLIFSCKKDSDSSSSTSSTSSTSTTATTSTTSPAKNTLTCKINGVAFTADSVDAFFDADGVTISASNNVDKAVHLILNKPFVGKHTFTESGEEHGYFNNDMQGWFCYFGQANITAADPTAGTISGTFNYQDEATAPASQIVITDGVFSIKK